MGHSLQLCGLLRSDVKVWLVGQQEFTICSKGQLESYAILALFSNSLCMSQNEGIEISFANVIWGRSYSYRMLHVTIGLV